MTSATRRDTTTTSGPRAPRLERGTAMRLALDEYARFADALAALGDEHWSLPTSCPDWDVRQLACHVVGMAEFAAGIRELVRQQAKAARGARRTGSPSIDALTDLQVRERDDWSPEQVVRGMRAVGTRAARGRRRVPGFVRRLTLPEPQQVGDDTESWQIGFLTDVILTRDTWMHRTDLAAATGHDLVITPGHDGVLVADVVEEWAGRHGSPFRLTLTGPAGGTWSRGEDGPALELDAVEFCRVVSGRGDAQGLLTTQVPF